VLASGAEGIDVVIIHQDGQVDIQQFGLVHDLIGVQFLQRPHTVRVGLDEDLEVVPDVSFEVTDVGELKTRAGGEIAAIYTQVLIPVVAVTILRDPAADTPATAVHSKGIGAAAERTSDRVEDKA
jgi:hypothetical protein